MWSSIIVWLWFASPWWLTMSGIFSCTSWPSVCLQISLLRPSAQFLIGPFVFIWWAEALGWKWSWLPGSFLSLPSRTSSSFWTPMCKVRSFLTGSLFHGLYVGLAWRGQWGAEKWTRRRRPTFLLCLLQKLAVTSNKSLSPPPHQVPETGPPGVSAKPSRAALQLPGHPGTKRCPPLRSCRTLLYRKSCLAFLSMRIRNPGTPTGEFQTVDRSASQKGAGFSVKASSLFSASFLSNSWGQIPGVTGDVTGTFLHLRRGDKRRFSRFCHVDLEYRREERLPLQKWGEGSQRTQN